MNIDDIRALASRFGAGVMVAIDPTDAEKALMDQAREQLPELIVVDAEGETGDALLAKVDAAVQERFGQDDLDDHFESEFVDELDQPNPDEAATLAAMIEEPTPASTKPNPFERPWPWVIGVDENDPTPDELVYPEED